MTVTADPPHVLLSCAVSVDGYLDDAGPGRLLLSNDEDFDQVDAERAACDAILVGATTIRRDDPRLLVRSARRRARRLAAGRGASPTKVTLSRSGDLDPTARFFTTGETAKLVYCPTGRIAATRARLGRAATVVDAGDPLDLRAVLTDLAESHGVRRLLVEGGGEVNTRFLAAGLVDELRLVVAPFFVGQADAPRFVAPADFPHSPTRPMRLVETRPIGDRVLLRYAVARDTARAARHRRWLREAIELSRRCPPSERAFSVGAVVVGTDGTVLATGHSREGDPHDHAEEAALAKLDRDDPRLRGATLYSSLEPCGARASRPVTCARLIAESPIASVVFAWREPPLFVTGGPSGADQLRAAGVAVTELPELAEEARRVNAHLLR